MTLPTAPWARVALSLFVVVHVLAGAGNVGRDTAPGKALRDLTKPWEKVLAVHQTWPMFAVPPQSTHWMEVTGIRGGGAEPVPLDALPGEPPHDGVVWLYLRAGKLQRNAIAKKRDYLRASITRRMCLENPELRAVRFDRASRRTPPPRFGVPFFPRPQWAVERTHLETWNCKKR